MSNPTYLAPHTTVTSTSAAHAGAVVGVAPRSDGIIEKFVYTGNATPKGSLSTAGMVPGSPVQVTALTPADARQFVAAMIAAIAAVAVALSGTVSVTANSTAITFSSSQTLPAGTMLFFSSQPGVAYYLASAVAGTSGTLTQAFSGSTAGGLGVTAA